MPFPTSVPTPTIWLKGDAGVTTSGDDVTEWADQSGNGNHFTQVAGANAPHSGTRTINGINVIDFDGVNDYLEIAAETLTSSFGYVFIVWEDDEVNPGYLLTQADEASTENFCALLPYGIQSSWNRDMGIQHRGSGASTRDLKYGDQGTHVAGDVNLAMWSSDGAAYTWRFNGEEINIGSFEGSDTGEWFGHISGMDNLTIGALHYSAGFPNPGDLAIAEIIVYDGVTLTPTQIEDIEVYLADRWNVAIPLKPDIEGDAYVNVTARARRQATVDVEGNAFVDASPPVTADAEGNAYVNVTAQTVKRSTADIEGNAFVTSDGYVIISGVASILGQATLTATPTIKRTGSAEFLGQAIVKSKGEKYTYVQNRILSGELIDQSNQSTFQFRVGGSLVNLSSTNKYQLGDLSVDYSGASLSWTELATTDIGSPDFALNATCQLDVDFGVGAGLERVFTGRIRSRNSNGQNNDHYFSYVAESTQRLADELTLINTTNRPEFEWTVGTTVIGSSLETGTEITTTLAYALRDAVNDVFTVMTSALANESIPATIGIPGLEQFTIDLPETVQLTNTNFVSGLEQLASLQPGVKVFFNERQQKWTFPNLLDLPTAVVDVSSTQITEAVFDKSVDDRYTAVRLIANNEDFLDNAIANNAYPFIRHTVQLEPNWVSEIQGDWTIYKALNEVAANGPFGNSYYYVYRKFKVPENAIRPIFGFPIRIKQKRKIYDTNRYRTVTGKLNWYRREWIAATWLIDKGNPHLGGSFVVPPSEVLMTYYPIQGMSFVTTVTSGTGIATVVSTAPISDYASEVRMPASGFEGTAYTDAGIERELVQIVSGTEVTTENAQALLDEYKNVIVSGTLPFAGDMIRQGVWLGEQLLVQHPTRNTGIQSVPGIITGYTHTFGRPGETNLELSSQPSGVLGNG